MSKRFIPLCIILVPVPAALPDISHIVTPENAPLAGEVETDFCHVHLSQQAGTQPDGLFLEVKPGLSGFRPVHPDAVGLKDIKIYLIGSRTQLAGEVRVKLRVKDLCVFGDLSGAAVGGRSGF